MRSMFRSVLVALVAVFAVGVVAAASASAAAPEFVTASFPISYSGSSGEVTFQTAKKEGFATIHCSASAETGEIDEAFDFKFLVNVHVRYTGCKSTVVGAGAACTTTGAAAGEIVTNALGAELVYTSKAAKEVGLVFKPETSGVAVAEFSCGGIVGKVKLSGAVVTKLASGQLGKPKTSFVWDYRQKAGVQEPASYEEVSTKVSAFLTTANGEQVGEEATETLMFGSSVEIAA